MKKVTSLLMMLAVALSAAALDKHTYVFNIAGNDTLRLDVYPAVDADAPRPALIFAFGGGFRGGHRDDARYLPLFEFLTENGVTVVSTDYRTRLRGVRAADMATPSMIYDRLTDAVTCAVSDYLHATGYVLAHAGEWNIDAAHIFAGGSSAGAITALQAENEICNAYNALPGLPADFNYAGVISFAGAVFSDGEPEWRRTPCPMLLFHGDADSNVPFESATVGDYGLWGSEVISKELSGKGVKHWFHRFDGADHSVAIDPLSEDRGEVLDFIDDVVAGRLRTVLTTERVAGPEPYRTDFTIEDYIRSNMR